MSISNLLDILFDKRNELITVQDEIKSACPALVERQECLENAIADLEAEIKGKAKFIPVSQAHTLVGKALQLVWTTATVKNEVDLVALDDLAKKHGFDVPFHLVETRSAFWSIKKRSRK